MSEEEIEKARWTKKNIIRLRQQLHDDDASVRSGALIWLCHLDDKESIPEIKKLLNDENEHLRQEASDVLFILEEVKYYIDGLFNDFMNEKFIAPRSPIGGGWEMTLPSGKGIVRSYLWEQAEPIIAYGPDAVPHLFQWLKTDNLPVRYIAVYSLGIITGIGGQISPFATKEEAIPDIEKAIVVWQEWYDNQKKK